MENDTLHNKSDTYLAKWLAGEITDVELKNLVSKDDYLAYMKIKKGLEVNSGLNASTEASFLNIQARIANKKTKVRRLTTSWAVGVAASLVILFGLFKVLQNDAITVETGFGESKTIVLLDGSEVILNSKSKIVYDEDNWENDRRLHLDGEAFFKVAKGETFVVETDNGSVTVLGTQFNVNSTLDFFDVVCYTGKVKVNTNKSETILLPNDGIRTLNKSDKAFTVSEKMPTWIQGESTFKSVPLQYVIKALEDNYDVKFDADEVDKTEVFTGSFPHDSLNIALHTVFTTLNISYNEKENSNIKLRYKE